MKKKIIHIVSADADPALLRSVAALHLAERQLGADSRLWTTRIVDGTGHQTHLPLAGQDWRSKLATGRGPAWFRRLWGAPATGPETLPAFTTATGLAERVKAARADQVHLHALRGELASAEELAALPGRLFWSVYDSSFLGGEADGTPAGRLSQRLLPLMRKQEFQPVAATVSLADKMRTSPLFQGRPNEVILPGIDPTNFHPDAGRRDRCREKLGIAKKTLVVMCDGRRLTPFGAEVLSTLKKELSGSLFILTLGTPCRPLSSRSLAVVPDGGGFSRALADCYRAADLWLGWEGDPECLPVPLLEAAACGTPAVLPEGDMAKNLISPEWNGLLVKGAERADWLAAILAVRKDREGYGAAACEQICTSFSPLNAARRLLNMP